MHNQMVCNFSPSGSGSTTALSGMHRYLYHVYCLTLPTSLCSDNTQNLHSSTVERILKTVPASKTKDKCAGNTPNTFILANRLRRFVTFHSYKIN